MEPNSSARSHPPSGAKRDSPQVSLFRNIVSSSAASGSSNSRDVRIRKRDRRSSIGDAALVESTVAYSPSILELVLL